MSRCECGGSAASPSHPDCNASNKAQLVPMDLSVCCLLSVQDDQDRKWGDGMAGSNFHSANLSNPLMDSYLIPCVFRINSHNQGPPHVSSQSYDTRTCVCSLTEPNSFMPLSLCSPRQSIQVSQRSGFTRRGRELSRINSHGRGQEKAPPLLSGRKVPNQACHSLC